MGLVEGAWQVCNERAASRTREAALMKRVSFHELAERELNDAALYYEQENAGLGFKFLEEVERYIGAIIKTPNAGQRVRGRVRRRILRTFPYAILYQTIAVTPIRDLHIADASALSLFDSEHSNGEDRWITLWASILEDWSSCVLHFRRSPRRELEYASFQRGGDKIERRSMRNMIYET